MPTIRSTKEGDLETVANIQARAFVRQSDCFERIECNLLNRKIAAYLLT